MAFEQKTASLDAGGVQYWVGGQGRPVLYIHSAGGFRVTPALDALSKDFRIYAIELPGFNGMPKIDRIATKADLAQLAAQFAKSIIGEKCDVIGHSFGGWVATWLAVDFPEVVDQLVLEAPAGFRVGGAGGLSGSPGELQKRMFAHPEKIPPETRSPDVLAANRATAGSYAPNDAVDPVLSKRLGDVAALTLVLHGTADGVIPVESPRYLKANLPHGHLLYVYDAAHNIEIDQPERFVELVGDFLRRGETFLVNAGSELAQA